MDTRQALAHIRRVAAQGPFKPDWAQITAAYRTPAWYEEAKFGIFIHWGLYAVPAFGNEWYARNMYRAGTPEYEHHIKTYGPPQRFGYKDFIPLFRAERFDPEAKATYWTEIDDWLTDPLYLHPGFRAFFDSRAAEGTDDLYPTVTIRQIMWALKMKPIPKQPWETVFDHSPI